MPTQLTVSVVEDHDILREATVAMLQENGFHAIGWNCAEMVSTMEASTDAHVYIIDINLPGESGLVLANRLRQTQPNSGIVLVTARSELSDRVAGYRQGADVYLVKPVDADEVLAVVHALKARIRREQVDGEWLLERSRLLLKGPKGEIFLTSSETRLLSDLVQAVGQTISREQVALHFNLTCEKTHSASIHVRLSQLRKKLRFAGVKDPSLKSLQKRGLKMCFKLTVQ